MEIVENKPFKNTLRSEISQTEEGKYCTISLISGIQKGKFIKTDCSGGYQGLGLER